MDLYLVSTSTQNTSLVSANGVPHYKIYTTRVQGGACVTYIVRPSLSPEDSIVAEIEWKSRSMPTMIRSPLLSEAAQHVGLVGTGIRALSYLYKRGRFSASRYFIGDDALEYQWKAKGVGAVLTRSSTGVQVASTTWTLVTEGSLTGQKRQVLRIEPCSIDIDLIVLTFVIMETKGREKSGFVDKYYALNDEVPQGDSVGLAEHDTSIDGGAVGEL